MAHDVFVSYSNKDKAVADAIVARVEQDGSRCWIAPRDITPGTSWGDAIEESISASRVMVLVLSTNSNRSPQVIREVERAVAGGVAILPFRIDDVDPTGAMAYFLATEHWLDAITPPMERHIERLSGTVRTLLSDEPLPPSERTGRAAGVRRTAGRPGPIAAIAGGATLLVGVVAAVGFATGAWGGGSSPTGAASPGAGSPASSAVAANVGLEQVGRFQPLDLDPTDVEGPGAIVGFDIGGTWLAYANGNDGITRVAIGDPANPRPMATYAMDGALAVAIAGDHLAAVGLPNGSLGVSFFQVDGSGAVTVPITASGVTSASSLEFSDGYAYVAGHDYIGVIDATTPAAPHMAFAWTPPALTGNPCVAFVRGGVGYFGAGWDGLYIFDLANPAAPVLLGHWASPNWVTDVVVADDIAYVTLGEVGLTLLDVSDPASPSVLGSVKVPGFSGAVDVADGHAFVGWLGVDGSMGGVAVVDVSDPAAPALGETYRRFSAFTHLQLAGDHLFVSDENDGLLAFRITGID